jgi:hypothetical protein
MFIVLLIPSTWFSKGNPEQAGLYTIMLRAPAHTRVAAYSHRDDRIATAISGTWHLGYGDRFDEAKLKALPPAQDLFAETDNEPVVVEITGFGPSSTEHVDATQDPRKQGKQN